LVAALDEASLSRFHLRAVLVSGMGFFTDAYDLFIIGIASTLIAKEWHLSSGRLALLNSTMLAAACLGAFVFGRLADVSGRKRVVLGGRRDHDRRGGGVGAVALVLGPRLLPFPARVRCRR
jgi:MFS family permease